LAQANAKKNAFVDSEEEESEEDDTEELKRKLAEK